MKKLKAWVRSFFSFSQREVNAFIILLPLMGIIIFSEPIYRNLAIHYTSPMVKDTLRVDSVLATYKLNENKKHLIHIKKNAPLFLFNPNELTKEGFTRLGFKNFIADRIIKYRSKGGRFYVKKDLLKIYGIDTSLYRQCYSFIDLPETNETNLDIRKEQLPQSEYTTHYKPKADLNKADTTQLIKINGIGKKLALRIIRYRYKLGGFVTKDQLKEVYGLDSVVINNIFKYFIITDDFLPNQINLNNATEKELNNHPYISPNMAKAILAYRFQHGLFKSVEDVQKIHLVTPLDFKRLKKYLTIKL